jgi:hypothetical protein
MTTLVTKDTILPTLYNSLATLTGSQTLVNKTIRTTKELVNVVSGAPTSTTNFDVVTQAISVYNSNTTTNFSLNVRADSTTPLSSVLAVGESIGVGLIVANGNSAYYLTNIIIDGVTQSIKYQSGITITAGNLNSRDLYNIFIIRTGIVSAGVGSYLVLASMTKFA